MSSDAGRTIEVLVAGAGPVGLALAAELARRGVALRIVDKAAARTDKSKALVVWSRTLELMEIMGCAERFVAAGRKITRANIYATSRRLARFHLDRVDSVYPFALFLPQSETERLLEEHLARFGVAVERGVELVAFECHEDGVVATLARADGTRETIRARWLAGCDGAHSFVRHTLGVPFAGETEPADFFLADLHLDGDVSADELSLFWHPEGVLGIFPMTPGRFRVIADLTGAARGTKPPDPTLAEVQAVLDRRGPGGLVARDAVWLSGFRINERKAVRYGDGSVFLVGDAAHIHSPAGGQGMNTGIQDAVNLAWKLAFVARGRGHPALLESYGAERSAVGERVLKNATRLTRLAILRGPARQALRNAVLAMLARVPAFQRRFAETMAELDISYHATLYPDRPMSVGPEGGMRAADREVRRLDGTVLTLYRLLREDRLVLLASASGGDVGDLRRAALMAIEVRYPSTVVAAIADGVRSLSVVRPDAYLGFADRGADLEAARSYLASFLNPG